MLQTIIKVIATNTTRITPKTSATTSAVLSSLSWGLLFAADAVEGTAIKNSYKQNNNSKKTK